VQQNPEPTLTETHTKLLEMAARLAGVGHWHFHVPSGRIVWSAETYRIHGLDPDSGEPDYEALLKLYDPDSGRQLSELVSHAIATGEGYEFRGTIVRPDGSTRYVAAKAECLRDAQGVVEVLFGVFQDVTEQTRSERFIRTLADSIPAMVGYWDSDLRCRYANLQYRDWFGRNPDEMIDLTLQELMGPTLFAKNEPFIRGALRGEAQAFERTLEKPSGEIGHMLARYIPEIDDAGRVLGILTLVTDVTAIKQTEFRLQKANELTHEALKTAQEALAAKRAFLANISHELRNPLTGIVGFAALLAREANLDERASGQLMHIRTAGETLQRTIDDLLDISRLDAGQMAIAPRPVDPRLLADDALQFFSMQLQEKNLTAELSADGLPQAVMLDPVRVRQIITNLISNAVKFTAAGRINVDAAYDETTQRLTLQVRDTGRGIAQDNQARLFQRFAQIDASTHPARSGTGLGLAICKELAEAMGGEVGFRSRTGEGSCFWVVLPAPRAEHLPEKFSDEPAAESERLLAGAAVLIVDDHLANRILIRQLLEPLDVDVYDAGSAAEALERTAAQEFDMILLDLMMPEVDGVGAARMIRAQGRNQVTPLIAFTAVSERDIAGEDAGLFDDILTKPISPRGLLELLLRHRSGQVAKV
jgi:PAS domain S-box-containing protein